MRKLGILSFFLIGLVMGLVFTYSCGGGGSSALAAGDADTLDGLDSTAFALSVHNHPEYATTTLLSSHAHSEYADSNHSHPEYMDAVGICSSGQVLKWNGSIWVCGNDEDSSDADTLDTLDSADFAASTHGHTGPLSSGYVSVPFMPSWNFGDVEPFYGPRVRRVFCYWAGPPEMHYQMNGAYCDTSVLWSGWKSIESTTTVESRFFTPVQLPDGATITSFQFWAYDNDPTYDGHVALRHSGPRPWGTAGGSTIPTPVYTGGSDNVPRLFSAASINPAVAIVDNSSGSFYLDAVLRGGTDVVLISAVIGYQFQ